MKMKSTKINVYEDMYSRLYYLVFLKSMCTGICSKTDWVLPSEIMLLTYYFLSVLLTEDKKQLKKNYLRNYQAEILIVRPF